MYAEMFCERYLRFITWERLCVLLEIKLRVLDSHYVTANLRANSIEKSLVTVRSERDQCDLAFVRVEVHLRDLAQYITRGEFVAPEDR